MSQNNSSSESIKCVVRCRPLNSKEMGLGAKCISISADSKVVIVENKDDKNPLNKGNYAMDRVFDETVTEEELFCANFNNIPSNNSSSGLSDNSNHNLYYS